MIQVKTQERQAVCPICCSEIQKIHSHYQLTLADVSWGSLQVCFKLTAKKFFCSNRSCQRRIFTQRLPTVVLPWARRTKRLGFQLTKIGLALGGLPGFRLTRHLSIKISRQTLLRLVMKTPTPSYKIPKVLGVDDWAYRKYHTYGTILVDLEQHQLIDLLSDRTASTLAQWLEIHLGIEIISRDRSKAYQKGANRACPGAIQVADRFHLLQNLAQILEVVLNQHRTSIKNVESVINTRPTPDRERVVIQPVPPPPPQKKAINLAVARREERKQKYDQAWALHAQGYPGKAIARKLGIGKTSVFCYLRTPTFPERKGRSDKGYGAVSPYEKLNLPKPPMNQAIAHFYEPEELAMKAPLPLTQHPAAVYLSQLAPKSRRTMRQSLNAIASMLTNGTCDAMTLDWSKLHYQHTAALLAVFRDKYAPATANRMLSALRRVLKEARRLKLMDADDYDSAVDFKGIKSTQLLRGRALSEAEISALLSVCQDDPTPKGVRDAAMISILMAGLRRSEVVNLDISDFDPKTGGLTIRRGKGMKDRMTYLPQGASAAVQDWLAIRGDEQGPLLYPVDKAGRITTRRLTDQAVMFVLQKRAAESSVAAFSPHDFRRTFITQLLDTGADVITVSRLAGHADPATTAKYDMRGEEVKRLAVARLKVPYRPRRPESE